MPRSAAFSDRTHGIRAGAGNVAPFGYVAGEIGEIKRGVFLELEIAGGLPLSGAGEAVGFRHVRRRDRSGRSDCETVGSYHRRLLRRKPAAGLDGLPRYAPLCRTVECGLPRQDRRLTTSLD